MIKLYSSVVLILLSANILFAQKEPFKFGNVDKEELLMKECSFYPEAKSMILGAFGELKFKYSDDKGFYYELEETVRIKIFDITDADRGNIKIRIYQPISSTSYEKIQSIKAYTFNLVDEKVEREKLKSDEYFEKRINDYWIEISFAIPNIQTGSVIEYKYLKTSDFITNLYTWKFQSDIPTALSEFRYTIPEFHNYHKSQLGGSYNAERDSKIVREEFKYSYTAMMAPGSAGVTATQNGTLTSESKWESMVMRNIPPIEEEPYMNNRSDVPSRLEFQLVSTQFPNQRLNIIAGDYDKFSNELWEHSALGKRLAKGNFSKVLEEDLQNKTKLEQAEWIYNYISHETEWNEIVTFLSTNSGRTTMNNKEGNVADINLTLIAALREYDIDAFPIILSTRGHGTVHPVYPSYEDFNYIIAAILIDDKLIYADATTGLPLGQLPLRCRNGNGLLITGNGEKWVNMKENSTYGNLTMLKSSISNGSLITNVTQKKFGYSSYDLLNKLSKGSPDEYKDAIASNFKNSEIKNFEVSESSFDSPMELSYDVVNEEASADIIYFQPMLTGTILNNPFTRESRVSTIDFPYAQSYKVIAQIEIPSGYMAEISKPAVIRLPNNKGSFIYNISQNGNMITIVSDLKINQTTFGINEYPSLKQFYELVASKNSEIITLKK